LLSSYKHYDTLLHAQGQVATNVNKYLHNDSSDVRYSPTACGTKQHQNHKAVTEQT
jgi:hypothetical protein